MIPGFLYLDHSLTSKEFGERKIEEEMNSGLSMLSLR